MGGAISPLYQVRQWCKSDIILTFGSQIAAELFD